NCGFFLPCQPAIRSRASRARPLALGSQSSSTISRSRVSACFAFSLPSAKAASARTKAYSSVVAANKGAMARGSSRTTKPLAARRDSPGTVAQELPPRFGEDAPEEEPHQDRDQEMGQDENTDVAVLAPHGLIFAQRSGRVNYGESLFLCEGHFSILEEAVDVD